MNSEEELVRRYKRRKVLIFAAIISFIAIAIIIVIAYINNLAYQTSTYAEITGYSAKNLPKKAQKNAEAQIRRILELHFDIPKDKKIVVTIRDDSVEEYSTHYTFLVDSDEYRQTFLVSVVKDDMDDEQRSDGVIISCPKLEYKKYPDSECFGQYNDSSSVDLYLPYNGKISTGEIFTVYLREYISSKQYIEINIDSCGDQSKLNEALTLTQKYLKNNGADYDGVDFHTRDLCEGSN